MCGIAGILRATNDVKWDLGQVVDRMCNTILHRGPDDSGIWLHPGGRLALGHRRLAVQDLSPLGHQPMHSRSGRFSMVLNGEIYNFHALRRDLESGGHSFKGHSDTEVLLAAMEDWGVDRAIERCAGMFAIAVWDERERRLLLIRDRLGEKPLYVGLAGDTLFFGSEIRVFPVVPGFRARIDDSALDSLLRFGYIPAPQSIYENCYKLSPGSVLELRLPSDLQAALSAGIVSRYPGMPGLGKRYWRVEDLAVEQRIDAGSLTLDEAVDQVDVALSEVVREQLIADVPVGAFLSGGVDSSIVVAAMMRVSTSPVRTFTIGFPGTAYDEAPFAEAVARHLGTDHQTLSVNEKDLLNIVPALGGLYDEPFADSSQVPTVLVSRLARQHVTVCLSGDGGDELFSGYNRYAWMRSSSQRLRSLPPFARTGLAKTIQIFAENAPPGFQQALLRAFGATEINARERLFKLAATLRDSDSVASYARLISYWQDPEIILRYPSNTSPYLELLRNSHADLGPWVGSMLWDQMVYLPGDNLAKVDRASMSTALETRLPLLDHRFVEKVWRVILARQPDLLGHGKHLLKRALYRYVPSELIERPKMGFTVPLAAWLRGPLREWADGIIADVPAVVSDHVRMEPVRAMFDEHQSKRRDRHQQLWPMLMLAAWAKATHIS